MCRGSEDPSQTTRKSDSELVCESGGHNNFILSPENIYVKTSYKDDPTWKCQSCQRIHLHKSGGVCSNCFKKLDNDPNGKCKDIFNKNYYSKSVVEEKEVFRLHCEETNSSN